MEYDEGAVRTMSTAKPFHDELASLLVAMFLIALPPSRFRILSNSGAIRRGQGEQTRLFIPDVVVAPLPMQTDPVGDSYALTEPLIIVEVLSTSSERHDRGRKWETYREQSSLQAYLLVSQDRPIVECYSRTGADEDWTYRSVRGNDATLDLSVSVDDETVQLSLALANLFAGLPAPEDAPTS